MSGKLVHMPVGGFKLTRELAAAGARNADIAARLGVSADTFSALCKRDEKALAALTQGRADWHDKLVKILEEPMEYLRQLKEDGLTSYEAINVLRTRSVSTLFLLKTRFNYQEHSPPPEQSGRVTVEFKLPAPLSPSQYQSVIEGKALEVAADAE